MSVDPIFSRPALAYMGVSKNSGTPKMDGLYWKTLLNWMIWGENPLFSETSICEILGTLLTDLMDDL